MAELKPCPFCGGNVLMYEEWADSVHSFYSFACKICTMIVTQNECVTENEAIEAWNRRAGDGK